MSTPTDKKPETEKPAEQPIEQPPAKVPTKEELEAENQAFVEAIFHGKKPKKEEEKKPAPAAEPPKKEPTEQPPAEPEPPKPKVKPPTKAELERRNAELAERLKKLEERQTPEPPEEQETPQQPERRQPATEEPVSLDLDDEDQEILDAVKVLERDPKYKGATKKLTEFWSKEAAYVKKWQAKHPGEEFDKNDSEHAIIYADEPDFDESELKAAKKTARKEQQAQIAEEAVKNYAKTHIDPKLKEEQRKKALEETAPIMFAKAQAAVTSLAMEVSPEFKQLIENESGPELAAKMEAADPVLFQVLNENAQKVDIAVQELTKVATLTDHYKLDNSVKVELGDGETFYPHQFIQNHFFELEKRLSRMDPKDSDNGEGKKFLPNFEYQKRLNSAKNQNEKQQIKDRFWTPGPDDIARFIVYQQAKQIRNIVDKANLIAERKAKGSGAKPELNGEKKDEKETVKKPAARSPSTVSVSDNQDNSRTPIPDDNEFVEKLIKSAF